MNTGTPIPAKDLLTLDHLHQFAYCPRRMHLMYVDGRWDNNVFTEEGRAAHARTDAANDPLPDQAGPTDKGVDPEPIVSRSVSLSSGTLGLVGKLDLVEIDGGIAVPVETKRGRPPDNLQHCYEPERVQLMAQALLLREHGFQCDRGMIYFAAARRRVEVLFTPELEARTLDLLRQARDFAGCTEPPPPLEESPKCNGCSLAGICLPDEVNYLNALEQNTPGDLRRLYPARDDALPLYVQEQGARVGKAGEALAVSRGPADLGRFPLKDVAQLILCGNVSISAQALHLLCERGIPIAHLSMGGWFYGLTCGHGLRNAYDRAAQFAAAANEARRIEFARAVIEAKARNQRTLLRRNAGEGAADAVGEIAGLIERIAHVPDPEALLGVEGAIAAAYFRRFSAMVSDLAVAGGFDFSQRNRRPPRDPVNAMLSFGYALLAKECTVVLMAEGLDPWWGLYHRPRHGRPALALDLMEEFRPLVVDSAVVTALNTGMVAAADFQTSAAGCAMGDRARKSLIQAYEQRLDQLMTHPVFEYRCSWRAVIRLQARLLTKWLRGVVPTYVGITTR